MLHALLQLRLTPLMGEKRLGFHETTGKTSVGLAAAPYSYSKT
jgi:hypothetical protein